MGARIGIGAFARVVSPQDPSESGATEFLDTMGGDPGLRLAQGRGRRTYLGGAAAPQVFLHASSHPNDAESLSTLPLKRAQRARNKTPHIIQPDEETL